ncbi:IucA/IucC family protein [Streptomyces antarcticus]|uniref:IucA/IucC family protein n=1 Tax=Streptomyces antarcticus TaxID=2996458 RepID=UPI00226F7DB7|nr:MULTISPECIES: IucA/IucC family protein [unclassified Streptomyces]MCY0941004.1 IucA/IucC family siderophore biosynthesis protein [Streptomyces sp. H34-AA3]MCY0949545.1 IucA/IucC family siderophore biosynthesis protein [Streptomyces sp. H27-S2]MCZ4085602.1 IucA/IucC family siderophore biosynthesis protein [Streptomyces sp. H34-S5]
MDRMEPVDLNAAADAYAATPLLNCLLREAAEPQGAGVHRLRGSGRLLRVRAGRRPVRPELRTADGWCPLGHTDLVKLTSDELRRYTGTANDELPVEIADSRAAVAALLAARAEAEPSGDPFVRSEQSLLMGHPHHPAPKSRGGAPAASWLPYAPEAHARFPLVFLGLREDQAAEEGGPAAAGALDSLADVLDGPRPPAGYRLLPAHPWQLELVGARPGVREAFADGRLLRLGESRRPVWPTASIRTVYVPDPAADLFVKFSLDVRITNDVRRLWRHDLLRLRGTDAAVEAGFAVLRRTGSTAAWLADRGYRTAGFAFEELAVLLRDGLHAHALPGATPLAAAALAEGWPGSPLAGAADPAAWWRAYLRHVVPPVLELFARHGVVLEAHLQNTLVAVDASGLPVQALFRDAEGVRLLSGLDRAAAWQRLVYCLVVNHLMEIAGALTEHHPDTAPHVWPAVREEFLRYDATRGLPEIAQLLAAPSLPAKTNLLLRWTRADGADARYLPLPNPLRV